MKKTKTYLLSALLALVLLFTSIVMPMAFQTESAGALAPEFNNEAGSIYYFTDYYPTLDEERLHRDYGCDIYYDRKPYISPADFYNWSMCGYFSGFVPGCIVIIDIKTFQPDPYMLEMLFTDLKNQDCKTIFVSPFGMYEYDDTGFFNYVDVFTYDAEFSRLKTFIKQSFEDNIRERNGALNNTNYYLDSRLMDIARMGNYVDGLSSTSPFLRLFLEVLLDNLQDYDANDSYSDMLDKLYGYQIKLFVEYNNSFFDLSTGSTIEMKVQSKSDKLHCAYGFWAFTNNFYSFLDDNEMPTYALIIDPIIYEDGGLSVISNRDLIDWYGEVPDPAQEELVRQLSF